MLRIVYLASSEEGLRWMFEYYSKVFPEGGATAAVHLEETETLLKLQPFSGRPTKVDGVRERRVRKTPFNLVYRVAGDEIEIVRVRDTRNG